MALLEVINMGHNFGGLRAVNEYNLTLEPGQITGLIGPNGAGKTTIFNLITGIYTPTDGDVLFEGKSIRGRRTSEIAALGLARTFQEMRLWRHMTVLEHVKMARYSKLTYGLLGALFDTPKRKQQETEATDMAMDYLKIFNVAQYENDLVGNLPYGAQRRVEMARAMVTEPKVLFLDEPTVGMTPEELQGIINVVQLVHERFNLAIFLIEHRLKFVRDLCTHVQALVFGELLVEGTPEEVQNNPKVIEAYLGGEED
ncbi:MAG: ABC transporter ATP-binding protein [Proteobacteria bacterium]|nr:ABC transporter ATP-binding protein [Pseudomonadota bacterium]